MNGSIINNPPLIGGLSYLDSPVVDWQEPSSKLGNVGTGTLERQQDMGLVRR